VAFRSTFTVTGGYRKTGTSFLDRVTAVTGRIFTEGGRNLILDFLHKKTAKNCENHQSSKNKYRFDFYDLKGTQA
jgi:hypothetical protein